MKIPEAIKDVAKELYCKLQSDAKLRQNDPVDTIAKYIMNNFDCQTWRKKDGKFIHDGDCRFWGLGVCTCGLIHWVMWKSEEREKKYKGDYGKDRYAKHETVLNKLLADKLNKEAVIKRLKEIYDRPHAMRMWTDVKKLIEELEGDKNE